MHQRDRDDEMLEQVFERMFAGDLRGGVKLLEEMKWSGSAELSEAVMRAKKRARPELYRADLVDLSRDAA